VAELNAEPISAVSRIQILGSWVVTKLWIISNCKSEFELLSYVVVIKPGFYRPFKVTKIRGI